MKSLLGCPFFTFEDVPKNAKGHPDTRGFISSKIKGPKSIISIMWGGGILLSRILPNPTIQTKIEIIEIACHFTYFDSLRGPRIEIIEIGPISSVSAVSSI